MDDLARYKMALEAILAIHRGQDTTTSVAFQISAVTIATRALQGAKSNGT